MIVKIMEASGVGGGLALMLCDDLGKPLPYQISSVLKQDVAEASTITVTFLIDGVEIRMAE